MSVPNWVDGPTSWYASEHRIIIALACLAERSYFKILELHILT